MEHPKKDLIRMVPQGKAEARDDSDGNPVLVGDMTVFDTWYEVDSMWEGNFLERFMPGSLDKTIKERVDKIKVLFNHGMDTLGAMSLGKIRDLTTSKRAASYEVPLFEGVPPLLLSGLRAGEYGSSLKFEVMGERWDDPPEKGGLPRRSITEAKLYEFGPVTFPANEAAMAGVRSQGDMLIWARLKTDEERRDFVRFLLNATSIGEVGGAASPDEAGDVNPEPEASTPFTKAREQFNEWKEKGYVKRAH